VPAALLRAGNRLKVLNYLNDLSGAGTGLSWLISRVEYDHETRTAAVDVGIPDQIATILTGLERRYAPKR
jgi:hypothetical protein